MYIWLSIENEMPTNPPPPFFCLYNRNACIIKREQFTSTSDRVSSKRQKHLKKDRYVVNFS